MMTDVAHTVMGSSLWSGFAALLIALFCLISIQQTYVHILGRKLLNFRARMRSRAALCLDKTGFIGAVLTRHTVLVTLNVLGLNLSLSLLATIRSMNEHAAQSDLLENSLVVLAGVCIMLILVIATVTFALCNEVVRLGEQGR